MTVGADVAALARRVRLAVFDVDGVLTDGRIVLGPAGAEYKCFNVRDGHGLVKLRRAGIEVAIITGRTSEAVSTRMRELDIGHVRQGVSDKLAELRQLLDELRVDAREACYVGDDEPDVAPMRAAGLPVAVADAVPAVQAVARWRTTLPGGHGAAREVADLILGEAAGDGVRA